MRQEPRLVLRTGKARARANAFRRSLYAFETMVDKGIPEEDAKRVFRTARLPEIPGERGRGTHCRA